jgi:hypothetical protein
MRPSELRLGNLITSDGEIFVVNRIDEEYVHAGALFISKSGFETNEFSIPLTEEWLIKFGFECRSYDNDKYRKNGIVVQLVNWADIEPQWKMSHLYGENLNYFRHGGPPILYVHQLQNLYFALIGEDLEWHQ